MKKYTAAAYYFPNFHPDARNEKIHGAGWSEWNLIRDAKPRFPGHRQPQVPVWGCEDESDPRVMAKKIDVASAHGLDVWMFDWYHYNDGPFLNGCLDNGFLAAPNCDKMKFSLMWANHDWYRIHGFNPDAAGDTPPLDFPGEVTRETFRDICDLVIDKYFSRPNYWKIDGCPVFAIYEIGTFAKAYESTEDVRAALDEFRAKVKAAGFPDLHLNIMYWGMPNLPGARTPKNWNELMTRIGADSATSYTWVHHGALATFPVTLYAHGERKYFDEVWPEARTLPVPYFPNVTVAWDNSPRCAPGVAWETWGSHVRNPMIAENTPDAFEHSLRRVKDFMDAHPEQPKVVTINAWNEWPEGSCLEPEARYGYGYLEALRNVFGE